MTSPSGHITPVSSAAVAPQVVTYVQLVEVDPRLQHQQINEAPPLPLPQQHVIQQQQPSQFHQSQTQQQMAYPLREDPPIALWKTQLRDRNHATCVHTACSVSFLTLPGILAHHKGCVGVATPNDYLPCNLCGLRFKQFKSLKSHQDREHAAPPPGPILVKGVQYVPMNTVGQQSPMPTFRPLLPVRDYSRTAEPSPAMPIRAAIQRLDDSSTPYAETLYMPKELENELEGPSTADTSTPETAARILAESKRISNARPRGRPRRNYQHPAEPPPRVVDVFDIGLPEPPAMHPTQQRSLPVARPCRMVQVQPMGESLLIVGQGSQGAAHLSQDHLRQPPQRQSQPTPLKSQLVMQIPAEAPSATPFMSVGPASSRTSSPAASSVSRHSRETPTLAAAPMSSSSSSDAPTTVATEPAPRNGNGEGDGDGELDAKERELADKEAKLRDYERIVLQSEEMAKKAARAEKAAELAEREKRIQEKEFELRQRLAQAVQVLEETRTTPPSAMTPPPPPPPPDMPARIPSVTPPAEPTSTGQIDESDSALSNDETSSVITTTSRTSREQVFSGASGSLKSPRAHQNSQKQEDPGDDSQLINLEAVQNASVPSPLISSRAEPKSSRLRSDQKSVDDNKPESPQISFKVIAMASESGTVQAGEEVAHILSDDIEIADPADLIEISTEGITEAVVLERSVDVVVSGASQHQPSETPPCYGGDADTSKVRVNTSGSEDIPTRAETPRRIRTPRTRRTSSISRKMNTRAQSLYEATVEAAKDMTSSEPLVSTCQGPLQTSTPSCGLNDTILPDQIHIENDEDIAAAVQTHPVTRMRQTLSQPQDKNSREPSSNYIAEDMKNPGNGNRRTRGQTQRYQEVETRKRRRGYDSEQVAQGTGETTIDGETPCQTTTAVPEEKVKKTRKRMPCQEVKQESAVELIQDLKEMVSGEPSMKRRRGLPRRCQLPSTDSDDLPTSTPAKEVETPKKRRSRKSHEPGDQIQSTPGNFECGKCAMTSKTKHDFLVHAAMHHGGLARKSGESQEFSEDEIQAAIRLSFMRSPSVSCYKCVSRKFTTQIGLNYHLSTCGKTKEELEAAKTPCHVKGCGYRGFPQNLRQHQNIHQKDALKEKERQRKIDKLLEEEGNTNDDATDGSRSRRRAAKKAQVRLSEAIAELKNREDDVDIKDDGEGDDDAAYVAANEADLEGRYDVKKSEDGRKKFHCSLCDFVGDHKAGVESHLVSEHAGYLAGDADDEFNDDDDDDISDEEPDVDFGDDEDDSSCFGEEHNVSRKKSTGHSRAKPSTLEPVVDYFFYERAFRRDNFDQQCFEKLNTTAAEWKLVKSEAEKAKFLPDDDKSPKFSFQPSHTKSLPQKPQQLPLFSSTGSNGNGAYLFAGGPICAVSWCPNSDDSSSSTSLPRFLALSTWRPVDDGDPIGGEKKALIQIWSYDASAKFRFGIAHPHGAVRSLQWCPSGNSASAKQKYLSRLGLLAAASSDGVVRVFSVCHPDNLKSNAVYLAKPVRTLETGDLGSGKPPDCLSMAWYRGVGHRVIAAGFSCGLVALWDLNQTEDSLQREGDKLFPYLTINAHMTMVTTIDLGDKGCKSEPEFPALILTGSADRHCSVWDLDGGPALTSVPVHSVKNSHVTDVKFVRSYPGGGNAIVAFDDAFRSSSTSVAALDFDASGSKAWPIASQNSPVWSLSYNPWLGSIVMGTGGGEVVLYVGAKIGKPLEFDKDTSRRRAFLFRTDEVVDEDPTEGPPDTYLNFVDSPVNNLANAPFDEQKAVRSSDNMTCEALMRHSLIAVNRVCFNQDLSAVGLVFAGTESGIGKFVDVSSLRRSSDIQKAMKACRQ